MMTHGGGPEETMERSIARHICTDFPDRVGIRGYQLRCQ